MEIQLVELAELRQNSTDLSIADSIESSSSTPNLSYSQSKNTRDLESKKLREELYCFLNRPIVYESIHDNRTSIYRIITSHVDFETELYLANKLKGIFYIK